jgi:pimeloyl-ACP methyl ester carboxylesterase
MSRWLLLLLLPLAGCLRLLTAPVPMPKVEDPSAGSGHAPSKCLLVLLPGVGDRATSFRDHGFIQALRERGIQADVVAADATLGYYLRGVQALRLERDVVTPALKKPYQQVWLAGISMGGFGSLHYAATHPAQIDGLVLFSPHLGEETVLQNIRDAGGLDAWQAPAPGTSRNYTEQAWGWLKRVTYERHHGPEIYLGYADIDTVVADSSVLAQSLPPSRVWHVHGGHTWNSWTQLWADFLDRSSFGARCR